MTKPYNKIHMSVSTVCVCLLRALSYWREGDPGDSEEGLLSPPGQKRMVRGALSVLQESHVVGESGQLLLVGNQRDRGWIWFLWHYHPSGRVCLPTLTHHTFDSFLH